MESPTGTQDGSTSVSTTSSATPAARTEERRVAALFCSLIEAECDIEGSMATLVEDLTDADNSPTLRFEARFVLAGGGL